VGVVVLVDDDVLGAAVVELALVEAAVDLETDVEEHATVVTTSAPAPARNRRRSVPRV
jgi:hypothetical protein